ncbi:cytochrome c3 family protein [Thermodesulfobacteriota bacterium]
MKSSGRIVLALVLGIVVAFAGAIAYAAKEMPKKPIVIDTKDVFTKKKKSPVVFPHAKHKPLKCQQCHHTWKEGEDVKKCGQCHKLKKTKDGDKEIPKLFDAYHKKKAKTSCVGCHKALKKAKKKTGPSACKKCHPKKKEDK